jgi:hypothetical protein
MKTNLNLSGNYLKKPLILLKSLTSLKKASILLNMSSKSLVIIGKAYMYLKMSLKSLLIFIKASHLQSKACNSPHNTGRSLDFF